VTLVLVVDDVAAMREQYAYDLRRVGGFETLAAKSGAEALAMLVGEPIDCVILDLEMPGVDGFGVLQAMKERSLDVPVVVYTGTGNYDRCIQAVRLGAAGFIDKVEPMERVVHEIEGVLERRRLRAEVDALRARLDPDSALVGTSGPMRELEALIQRLAPIPSPVLIVGESGSGKELVARELHRRGTGPREPFVAMNCAALPEQLVESELFGHERGAFTGAHQLHKGAFEVAGTGTLFLDEVGELPAPAQAKLLRVLEQREITRVGGTRPIRVTARVIAATNRNLEEDVAGRRFRQDLYFRLNVHLLTVPPLRDRRSDIPDLVGHLLASICERFGIPPKTVAPEALDLLMAYDWRKNNVRELRNVVERMVIAADGAVIGPAQVPAEIRGDAAAAEHRTGGDQTFQALKAEAERQIVIHALERHDWQITRTAKALGLADHASLLKIMRRHDIARRE
jgi:DNA-binding NtrC family response regulator